MSHYTPDAAEITRLTPLEMYLDLYFEGLTPLLRQCVLNGATHGEIASLLSDNPYQRGPTAATVSAWIRQRRQDGRLS